MKNGVLAPAGLIAHGRGEAFDYLLGERTTPPAEMAERVAAAALILAEKPVISVNGNTAALCAKPVVKLSRVTEAKLEVNMFHWSVKRGHKIVSVLKSAGAENVLFGKEKRIPGIHHSRSHCTEEGIFSADAVLVPLEDGDRANALVSMGKCVIAIDLNPLSRTAKSATITVVDELTRAVRNITTHANKLKKNDITELRDIVFSFDNDKNLSDTLEFIRNRLTDLQALNSFTRVKTW